MQKLQILFPAPVLNRLREIANQADRPVSELVRRAVDDYLEKQPHPSTRTPPTKIPTFNGGQMKVSSSEMKELAYQDRLNP